MTERPDEELQALYDAATPGPWFAASMEGDDESWFIWSAEQEDGTPFPVALMSYEGPDVDSDGEREEADAEFIAAARSALPSLLARVVAAEKKLAAVEALFSGGPDTACRTVWHGSTECVSVPLDDLRAALADEVTQ